MWRLGGFDLPFREKSHSQENPFPLLLILTTKSQHAIHEPLTPFAKKLMSLKWTRVETMWLSGKSTKPTKNQWLCLPHPPSIFVVDNMLSPIDPPPLPCPSPPSIRALARWHHFVCAILKQCEFTKETSRKLLQQSYFWMRCPSR